MRVKHKGLFDAVNYGWREIIVLASRGDHSRIGTHQVQGQTTKNLAGHFAFLHPLAPRQYRRQLSHLSYCSRMQSAKSLNRKRKEDNALEAASFFSILDLSLIGLDQSGWT